MLFLMQRVFLVLITTAYLAAADSGEKSKRTYADHIGTHQFLFVGLSNCRITTERNPPPGTCPYHTTYQTSTFDTEPPCSRARMHLWLSVNTQPKVFILGSSIDDMMVAQLNRIKWPQETANQFSFHQEDVSMKNVADVGQHLEFSKVIWTIFDTYYRFLYVVVNRSVEGYRSVECHIFTVSSLSEERVSLLEMGHVKVHRNNDRRTLWTEDPYQRKFYYTIPCGEGTELFSVPYNQILLVLANGEPGKSERTFPESRQYISVSRGIVVGYRSQSGKVAQFTQDLEKQGEKGLMCETKSTNSRLSKMLAIYLLFDEDYCRIRDGSTTAQNCSSPTNTPLVPDLLAHGEVCSSSDTVYWLLAAIFILCCFVLVLAVHVWRTRQRMDETFMKAERPQIHYYPTFVSEPSLDF